MPAGRCMYKVASRKSQIAGRRSHQDLPRCQALSEILFV